MAKQKKKRRIKNPVARCMETFNRPATHRDKTKYNKKEKHKGQDKGLYFWLRFLLSTFMSVCHIHYRNYHTGGAWWPCPLNAELSFKFGTQYKVFDRIYVCDTTVFRLAIDEAMREITWEALKNKS